MHTNTPLTVKCIRQLPISAASGLVQHGNSWFVVADDELSLLEVPLETGRAPITHKLFEGMLPTEHEARKKAKPDLETLALLPGRSALVSLPSGSKSNRTRGVYVGLEQGFRVREISTAPLYQELSREIPVKLSIEGILIYQDQMHLLHRGNSANGFNAIIDLDQQAAIEDLHRGELTSRSLKAVSKCEVGACEGIPLTFTDGFASKDGLLFFIAVAEATKDAYEDGAFRGAVMGALDRNGNVLWQRELQCPDKPEGLWLESDLRTFTIVTDADDNSKPASMLQGRL